MNRFVVLIIVLLAVTVFIVWMAGGALRTPGSPAGSATLAYQVTALVLLLTSLVLGWRGSLSQALRYAMFWLSLFFGLILAYSYRSEFSSAFQRVSGEINPAMPLSRSASEVSLRRSGDGHFYVDASINGTDMRLLADTGASTIALSMDDAENAGIDVNQLDFTLRVSTANGTAAAAQVTLDEVRVGSIVRKDVTAIVARGLSGSLLGMNFFNSLSKFQIENDELLLRD
ncbi:MAG: TIGR02281 family clan AA aspartic protease [Micropepsaceae bacterium]